MFQGQAPSLGDLLPLLPKEWGPQFVHIMQNVVGQCQASLSHAGPVSLAMTHKAQSTKPTLEVSAYPAYPSSNDDPTLPDGDPGDPNGLAFKVANGAAIFLGPVFGVVKWAKAAGNWVNVAGDGSYVDCTTVVDYAGTASEITHTIRVYLPRFGTAYDPAIYTNAVFPYLLDKNGRAIWAAPVLSSQVGDISIRTSSSSIPTGWQQADGTNGTWDLRDYHLGGYKSGGTYNALDGTTVYGQTSITPTISGNGGTIALTIGNTDLGSHGHPHTLTLSAHTHPLVGSGAVSNESAHTHTVTVTGNDGTGAAGAVDVAYPGGGTWTTSGGTSHTHTLSGSTDEPSTNSVGGSITSTALGSHTHASSTVSSNSIAGTLSVSAVSTVPPTKAVFIIQRIL